MEWPNMISGRAGMLLGDPAMYGRDVCHHFADAIGLCKPAKWCVGRRGRAMATMVMRVDVEACRCQRVGKTAVALCVFGNAMIDVDDADGITVRPPAIERKRCAAWRRHFRRVGEWHSRFPLADCRLAGAKRQARTKDHSLRWTA